ncbi:MAG: serpin family protein [Terracidiphilus sp.]|jgi:serpin B
MKRHLLLLFACLVVPQAVYAAETSPSAAADQAAVVKGNNAFAVELYGQLRSQDGNLFFSPESISTALAMSYAGARGDTASEMAKTLHFTLPPDRFHPAVGALLGDLNVAHSGYQLRVANALWAQQGYTFLDDFIKLTASDYGAGFNQVDFKGATETARLTINQWVEQKTDYKIKDLLQPGVLNSTTRLVLTNAIYFKGTWQRPFHLMQTEDEDFHLSKAQSVKVPMMHQVDAYNYFDGGKFQALGIPYKSDELSMIVFLPKDIGGLPALEQSLTASKMQQWLSQLQPVSTVILTMPRFKTTQQFELQGSLGAMGMPQAFGASADFSGMTGSRDLWISAVIHKAFIDVNEEGTEAAAATAITMVTTARYEPDRPPPIVFSADHPFVFLIRDNRSGGILFMGRVTDPTK